MRFGIFTSMGNTTWANVLDLWRPPRGKPAGTIACVTDHLHAQQQGARARRSRDGAPSRGLSALVPRLRVGTIVLGNTYRHPAVVAKMAAQVGHHLGRPSPARRWARALASENEHEAYGILLHDARAARAPRRGACQVIRSLWTERPQRRSRGASTRSRTRRSTRSPCRSHTPS
jgi:alkanesulfonate monooxygenase SsuD/methylene tetrahydromethanopterin reductase-like flavin-dependent oxidoreductase (luciferase family)